jgi:hypothetical protein
MVFVEFKLETGDEGVRVEALFYIDHFAIVCLLDVEKRFV